MPTLKPWNRRAPLRRSVSVRYNRIVIQSIAETERHAAAGLIKSARRKANLSQAELARRAGVPATTVGIYERAQRQPTLPMLLKLLRAAGQDLQFHLVPYDDHDRSVEALQARWTPQQLAAANAFHDELVARGQAKLGA